MTDEQKAAYINAMAAAATAQVAGMVAENMQRQLEGKSMAYREEQFADVIDRYGIHPNAIMVLFQK